MKIFLSMIENCDLTSYLPRLVTTCVSELLKYSENQQKKYQSMILQTLCMCLKYDPTTSMQSLGSNTYQVFYRLYLLLSSERLEHSFEYRRVIFGLTSVVRHD